ncbi:hypothetical protein [Fibrobacter sp.]|uniref:hypothetical protein n=1 Tax=Fibrobacter sp. TaxID=35828 RepID=UPI003869D943
MYIGDFSGSSPSKARKRLFKVAICDFERMVAIKTFSPQYLQNDLYAKFIKDVSLEKIEDELLLRVVDEMTDIKYEKESSFLDGMDAKAREMARKMLVKNKPVEEIVEFTGLSESEILGIKG